jgi:pimeloyl-ACP methyl ester carboxylesterase
VIGPLTDPTGHGGDPGDAFHVVCPSLPGYGFSDKPTRPGWTVERIAGAWTRLMARLGYDRYGAVGSDWGTSVSAGVGQQGGEHVVGIHLVPPLAAPDPATFNDLTEAERATIADLRERARSGDGYSAQQGTRPQTLGYGLVDSPAALCAWLVEKFSLWTDPRSVISRDELLDNLMLYWIPGTGTSSARLYWESIQWVKGLFDGSTVDPVTVPTGCSVFPKEVPRISRRWAAKRFTDIRYWSEPDRGGHFAAFEQPELFVHDVRAFFRLVR